MILRLIGTLSLITLVFIGGLVAALPVAAGGYRIGHWAGWSGGYEAGKAAIVETVNKRNAAAAQVARGARDDIDRCFNAGGDWIQDE